MSVQHRVIVPKFHFLLTASIVVSFLASTSVPTPIYPVYQHDWGLTAITITVIFGVYSLAVLAALLTVGELSDFVGRKPLLLAALAGQFIAMMVFAGAPGPEWLIVARVIQGIAIGAALGAVGAALIDINRAASTLANAMAPTAGCAAGLLGSALAVQHLPAPTQSVYIVLAGIFVMQAMAVASMPETSPGRAGKPDLRPRFALPPAARRPILVAAPVVFAAWALAGFYGSLGPALAASLTGSDSALFACLPMFLLTAVATGAVVVLRHVGAESMFGIGVGALILGLAITLASIEAGSIAGFCAGTAVAGVGFAGGFQGGIRTVVLQAGPEHRAGVMAVLYSFCYLGFGAPAVLAGYLSMLEGDPVLVARQYGLVLLLLAGAAALGSTGSRLRHKVTA